MPGITTFLPCPLAYDNHTDGSHWTHFSQSELGIVEANPIKNKFKLSLQNSGPLVLKQMLQICQLFRGEFFTDSDRYNS